MPRNNRATSARWMDSHRPARNDPSRVDTVPAPRALPASGPQPLIEAAEIWAAIALPALLLEAVAQLGSAPLVVLDPDRGIKRVVAMTAAARERGVTRGLSLSAALALAPDLMLRARDPRRERALLLRIAALALEFSPRVSLEPPDGVLLEVKGSLKLFGGVEALCTALRQRCAGQGTTVRLALAPTPLAALAGVRASRTFVVTSEAQLVGQLAPLPLAVLRWPPETLERLGSMGVHTLGEILRLPRAGFSKRFGRAALEALDRLVGRRPEPRQVFVPRERFRARCEPSFEIADQATILRYLEPLLADLERFLRSRQCAVSSLQCRLWHRRGAVVDVHAHAHANADPAATPCTRIRLGLAAPEFAAERFSMLLGEHLARTPLPASVTRCELRSGELLPFTPDSESLWRIGEHGGAPGQETPAFIERLRARLGPEAVYGLCLVPEHRPESAWCVAEPQPPRVVHAAASAPAPGGGLPAHLRRPLWLLQKPEPLQSDPGLLQLLEGPERIESGWWDGNDVARDYYIARHRDGAQLWVFRERDAEHGWFLHGVFG